MKQTIKDFLLRKRFFKKGIKVLKNKKGFSLMEVLIAVAIIGIISGIAVPQFIAQKNNAAKVASDTSAGNIAKAFKNCIALGSFNDCKTLAQIKVSCPAGSTCVSGGKSTNSPASQKFCAHLKRGGDGDDFKVCIQVDGISGTEKRSYGGALLANIASGNVCHVAKTASGDGSCSAEAASVMPGLKSCTTANITTVCGTDDPSTNTTCGTVHSCAASTGDGTCDPSTGLCS